jgi:hypothetical protein
MLASKNLQILDQQSDSAVRTDPLVSDVVDAHILNLEFDMRESAKPRATIKASRGKDFLFS